MEVAVEVDPQPETDAQHHQYGDRDRDRQPEPAQPSDHFRYPLTTMVPPMMPTIRVLVAAAALGAAFDGSPGQVAAARQRPAAPPAAAARPHDGHLPHAALEAELRALAAAHAGSATLVEMGRTAGGRRLWAIEIAAPGAAPPGVAARYPRRRQSRRRPGRGKHARPRHRPRAAHVDRRGGPAPARGLRVLYRAAPRRRRHRGGVRAAAGAAPRQSHAVRRRQ